MFCSAVKREGKQGSGEQLLGMEEDCVQTWEPVIMSQEPRTSTQPQPLKRHRYPLDQTTETQRFTRLITAATAAR